MSRSRFTVVGLLQPPDPPALVASLTCRICNAAATQSTTDEGDRPDQGIEKEMAEHEVLLYIYDLSQGMAASMSMQLCGKFIPGIWHTAVTIPDFGVEVFFGQGLSVVPPGTSHHGQPHKIQSMGHTSIDKDTFLEYIEGVRQLYTAERYHLLDFNCNNFTQDVVSFLTGNSIPSDISDLPKEFLSTPFGQSLRPMIENMYTGGYRPDASQAVPGLLNGSNNSNDAAQPPAPSSSASSDAVATSSLTSPLSMCTNLASFQQLLTTHDVLVVMFTSQSCPPCRTIKPVFEDLAMQNAPDASPSNSGPTLLSPARKSVAFAVVDTSMGREIASRYAVSATPTFRFYLKGHQTHELKGANAGELKMQVALLLDAAYPPHPHNKLKLTELRRLSTAPAVFDSKPNFEAALARLEKAGAPASALATLKTAVVPFLSSADFGKQSVSEATSKAWREAQEVVFGALPLAEWFPGLDLLRYAASAPPNWTASVLLDATSRVLKDLPAAAKAAGDDSDDKTWTVALRLLTNLLPAVWLEQRAAVTSFIIEGLLHGRPSVRTSAATCAFRASQLEFQRRPSWVRPAGEAPEAATTQEEWETEMVTASMEALGREERQTETGHRLMATLGMLLFLSQNYEGLGELAQALGVEGQGAAGGTLGAEVLQLCRS